MKAKQCVAGQWVEFKSHPDVMPIIRGLQGCICSFDSDLGLACVRYQFDGRTCTALFAPHALKAVTIEWPKDKKF